MAHVQYETDGPIGVITLDRAEKANAVNQQSLDELHAAWMAAAEDRDVKVIVLKANGKHFSAGHDMTGSDEALNVIDLSAENLVFAATEAFRASVRVQHDGAPGIARDMDGSYTPNVNWIYDTTSMAWGESSDFNVTGDWVIRATVDVMGVGGQGGWGSGGMSTGGGSTGGGGGGAAASGADSEDDSSCGCRVGVGATDERGPHGAAWLLLMMTAAAVQRKRRRR